jgi:hypothetical protein
LNDIKVFPLVLAERRDLLAKQAAGIDRCRLHGERDYECEIWSIEAAHCEPGSTHDVLAILL